MKKTYLMPQLDIENVVVEQGIAASTLSTINDALEVVYGEEDGF